MVTMNRSPLKDIDIDSDISAMSFQRLSFFEKIGLISSLLTSMGILVIAIFSFFVDLSKLEITSVVADLILTMMGLSSLYFIYGVYSKKIITENLIDTAFQEGIYNRLRPLIENIAQNHIGSDVIMDHISKMDLKLQNILIQGTKPEKEVDKYTEDFQKPIMIGTSLEFTVKSIFMVVITMAIFMFFVNFNIGSLTPFVSLSIYVLWWVFITNEYNLWKENSAWYIAFLPIVIVPVSIMVLGNLTNYNILMAILYASVGIYAFAYYIWAVYTTTDIIPFINKKIEQKSDKSEQKLFALQHKGMLKLLEEKFKDRIKFKK